MDENVWGMYGNSVRNEEVYNGVKHSNNELGDLECG